MTPFSERHIGPDAPAVSTMLARLGFDDLDALTEAALPAAIRTTEPLRLPEGVDEADALHELRDLGARNQVRRSMIGLGYYGTRTPAVIRRNVLEDPGWYTAYTPYQPEISQGRLEALLGFQTMVADLTGLAVAGASMLDEATAAAEAMTLARRASKAPAGAVFVVDADVFPQTVAVLRTRARPLGLDVVLADTRRGLGAVLEFRPVFGVLVQYPGASGRVDDHVALVEQAHAAGAVVVVAADLLALTMLRPPGEIGADAAVGTSQRFGVPMGYGGPHAGYLAVRAGLERALPGRLVGVSHDADGAPAYRLALQTREQHIRREKATSNICTAQVLLAVMAAMYAVYHGPAGLRAIAERVHRHALELAAGLRDTGFEVVHQAFFDTLTVRAPGRAAEIFAAAHEAGYLLRLVDADTLGLSVDETTSGDEVGAVVKVFGGTGSSLSSTNGDGLPSWARRRGSFLTHPVFSSHHSETAMLRYLRRLEDADYALNRGMIPLGSCTMKLNATAEMEPISWPQLANLHPFAPQEDAAGSREVIGQLERWLAEITGYDAVSVQPNAGSQGELAGLLAVRAYHEARGDADRRICLVPSSAHGTNAASAVMAGLTVVVVRCDERGNIDLADLRAKAAEHADDLAAVMVTYPSTHGVFEESVTELCDIVHAAGGQVYLDGANLNALVGLARPGRFGADVSHLNLHKTFCIPHGGGGPGVGPVAVRSHLAPYLPAPGPLSIKDFTADQGTPGRSRNSASIKESAAVGPVSAAPYGSAGILPISWAYIRMMGPDGLRRASQVAILAANYVAARLRDAYPVLYTGTGGLVAHECILDLRPLTKATGVSVDDVAKRLIDYGFHAPTMSFPVAGTLMVEPTESEDLAELDRFCDAMLQIRAEIDRVADGEWPADDNPLRNAPHTARCLVGEWRHPYSREAAAYPPGVDPRAKYWPPVRRVDSAYGDRNLMCSCPPVGGQEA